MTPPSLKGNFYLVKIAFKKSQKKTKQKKFQEFRSLLEKKSLHFCEKLWTLWCWRNDVFVSAVQFWNHCVPLTHKILKKWQPHQPCEIPGEEQKKSKHEKHNFLSMLYPSYSWWLIFVVKINFDFYSGPPTIGVKHFLITIPPSKKSSPKS